MAGNGREEPGASTASADAPGTGTSSAVASDPASAAASSAAASGGGSRSGTNALLVAMGIFLSRIAGLVRQRFLAHYLGISDAADTFNAALRIPNFLQNLFGEGVLSASFIPVYARLRAEGNTAEATRVANVIAGLLAVLVSVLVLLGVLAPASVLGVTVPGFEGEKLEHTIHLVRVLFPGAGLLVMSAWCLGVLNSHRKFLLSYTAPVLWNAAIIAALLVYGRTAEGLELAEWTAWGAVAGSALQLGVQLPSVFRLLRGIRPKVELSSPNVRQVVRSFVPVFIGRGVVQISAYIDQIIASLLPSGAISGITNAQVLYTLPISLFGMSISAAELPEMSAQLGTEREVAAKLRARLDAGLRRISFFVVPSAVAFLALGDVLAGALLQTGAFTRDDSVFVWTILAGSAPGVLASTRGRLYSSTYYALRDTKTPLHFALVRVALASTLGYLAATQLPTLLGVDAKLGAAGITLASGLAGWVEYLLLRGKLNRRIGVTGVGARYSAKLWVAATLGAAVAWAVRASLPTTNPLVLLALAVGPYGLVYFAVTRALGVPESAAVLDRVLGKLRRR